MPWLEGAVVGGMTVEISNNTMERELMTPYAHVLHTVAACAYNNNNKLILVITVVCSTPPPAHRRTTCSKPRTKPQRRHDVNRGPKNQNDYKS